MDNPSNTDTNPSEQETNDEKWAKSKSKALLHAGLISGEITPTMKPKQVWNMHPSIHGKWNYVSWSNNLHSLRSAINRDRGRMLDDVTAYGNDREKLNNLRSSQPNPKPVWHTSDAAKLLKQDIKEGKHETMKPKELHKTRPEYLVFDLGVFCKHIYQELDSVPKREMRFERKKKAWKYPKLHKDHPRLQNDNH